MPEGVYEEEGSEDEGGPTKAAKTSVADAQYKVGDTVVCFEGDLVGLHIPPGTKWVPAVDVGQGAYILTEAEGRNIDTHPIDVGPVSSPEDIRAFFGMDEEVMMLEEFGDFPFVDHGKKPEHVPFNLCHCPNIKHTYISIILFIEYSVTFDDIR